MKAVIMAGGEGSRLRPLTCNIPKPMVPVINRPMMEHIVCLLRRSGIQSMASTLWYLPDRIRDYFDDGTEFGVSMEYFVETKPLGTAGSVKNGAAFLDDTFVVISGDCLTDIDLNAAIASHRERQAIATIVLTRVSSPLGYGVVITQEDGRICQFLEKPSWGEVFSDTVNSGIYILEPEVLRRIPSGTKFDFSQDVFPMLLAEQAPLYGYTAAGYWSDVGSLDVYRQVQRDCLAGLVEGLHPAANRTAPGLWQEGNAFVSEDAHVEGPVLVGSGAMVKAGAQLGAYTVIGRNSLVEEGASLKRTILWPLARVGKGCQLRGAILGANSTVERDSCLYEGAIVGDQSTIGRLSAVDAGVKVWPQKKIPSGTHLHQSLVWGNQDSPSLFCREGIRGDLRGSASPENLVKAALAYGAHIGKENSVLLTCDGSADGRLVKRCLACGFLTAGLNVYDGGTVSGGLARFSGQILAVAASLSCHSAGDGQIVIHCWDEDGLALSNPGRRKVENWLSREDFPRYCGDDLGMLQYVPGLAGQYLNALVRLYRPVVEGRVRVVLDMRREGELGRLMHSFCDRLGCDVGQGQTAAGSILLVLDGDRWNIFDESGRPLTEDDWWCLLAAAAAGRTKGFAVPVDRSQAIEEYARQGDLSVQWTKTDMRSWMEVASELGSLPVDVSSGTALYPSIEPLVGIGEILALVARRQKPLAELRRTVEAHRVTKSERCPWEKKGQVMRKLIEAAKVEHPEEVSFLDGIKHFHESGWVLVMPDGDEPVFRICGEAQTQEEADAITDHYQRQIRKLLHEEEVH